MEKDHFWGLQSNKKNICFLFEVALLSLVWLLMAHRHGNTARVLANVSGYSISMKIYAQCQSALKTILIISLIQHNHHPLSNENSVQIEAFCKINPSRKFIYLNQRSCTVWISIKTYYIKISSPSATTTALRISWVSRLQTKQLSKSKKSTLP